MKIRRIAYLDGRQFNILAEAEVNTDDLNIKSHPNAMPFSGTLLLVDQPSDKPPQGADGHRILVPRNVAEKLIDTLPGMGVNFSADADRHEATKKVGVIHSAWIDGNKVKVKGVIWSKDFPKEAQEIKANSPRLGMSMELADVWVENKNSPVWTLTDFKFTGGAILLKNAAAYYKTALAAAAEKKKRFYAVALKAAAAVIEGKIPNEGDGRMPTPRSKSHRSSSRDKNKVLVQQLAAATAAGVSANLQDSLAALNQSVNQLTSVIFAARKKRRRRDASDASDVSAAGEPSDASDVSAAREPSDASDVSAAGEPSDASDMSAAADEFLAARKRRKRRKRRRDSSDASDVSAAGDPSDASDMSAAREPSDASDVSAAGEPSDASDVSARGRKKKRRRDPSDASDMSAGVEPSDYGSSDPSDASAEPGDLNKNAMAKFRKHSKEGISAAADRYFIKKVNAQMDRLAASNRKLKKSLRRRDNVIDSMQAQIDMFTSQVNRRTVSPELSMILSKGNYNVAELQASGEKIPVDKFDQLFAMAEQAGIGLGTVERIMIKNQATQLGILDDGAIQRYQ